MTGEDDGYGCCALDEGHDGACAWVCSDCNGSTYCGACGGPSGDDMGTGCGECDGTGYCSGCYEGMVVDDVWISPSGVAGMSELCPTKTRLALLRDVGRACVLRFPSGETRCYFDDGSYSQVNARIGEVERAGWVRIGGVVTDRLYPTSQRPRLVQLTRDGEAVLAAAAAADEAVA